MQELRHSRGAAEPGMVGAKGARAEAASVSDGNRTFRDRTGNSQKAETSTEGIKGATLSERRSRARPAITALPRKTALFLHLSAALTACVSAAASARKVPRVRLCPFIPRVSGLPVMDDRRGGAGLEQKYPCFPPDV